MQTLQIHALDGAPLTSRLYAPHRPIAAVLLAGAVGVPQGFYRRFATHLTTRGLAVLTTDYRGIGESRPTSLRGFRATLRDWGENDLGGALDTLDRVAPDLPKVWLAHSFGGQALGLAPVHGRVRGALAWGSQLGALRNWPLPHRQMISAQLRLFAPLVRQLGYAPGWMGLGEDVPEGVVQEWSRWCHSANYLLDHVPGAADAFQAVDIPVRLLHATDDSYAPRKAVEALAATLPQADVHAIDPAAWGLRSLGHFDVFRPPARALWDVAADTLADLAGVRALPQAIVAPVTRTAEAPA